MSSKPELQFEASAYLQTLIGRELFRTEEVAIVELVKNAYDSGATAANIVIRPRSPREPGEIVISDNGSGMTLPRFKELFMFAGYSERPQEVSNAVRIPTGEKGIGRFASDRLGSRLQVITKVKNQAKALCVDIDWTKFANRQKRFHDITVPYRQELAPEFPANEHGTILRITNLREPWDRSQVQSLQRALAQLIDPFYPPPNFEINLQVPGSTALSGIIQQEPISEKEPDIIIRFRVNDDGSIRRTRRGKLYSDPERDTFHPSVDSTPIAGLSGVFLYFLGRPNKEQTKGIQPGVKIYRDGFRVQPFGSEAADWLGIAEKRAKRAGHAHVVPSRLFGFVAISRKVQPKLQDTTSREALLDTDAARSMVNVLREQLLYLEESVKTDVAAPRWQETKKRRASATLQTLNMMSIGLAHELKQPLQTIRTEAAIIDKRLRQLGIQDAYISTAQRNIDQSIERIDRNIRLIAAVSSGNTDEITRFDLAVMLRDECQLLVPRCASQGIELVQAIPENQVVALNATTITTVLFNLVQNAIEAHADVNDSRPKKITVSLRKEGADNILEVADNALGIPDEIKPHIFRRFNTNKTGGWGVALYNCQLLVKTHGGEISFDTQARAGTKFTVRMPNMEIHG